MRVFFFKPDEKRRGMVGIRNIIDEMNYSSGRYCANLPPYGTFASGKWGRLRAEGRMGEGVWPDMLMKNEIVHYDSHVC